MQIHWHFRQMANFPFQSLHPQSKMVFFLFYLGLNDDGVFIIKRDEFCQMHSFFLPHKPAILVTFKKNPQLKWSTLEQNVNYILSLEIKSNKCMFLSCKSATSWQKNSQWNRLHDCILMVARRRLNILQFNEIRTRGFLMTDNRTWRAIFVYDISTCAWVNAPRALSNKKNASEYQR